MNPSEINASQSLLLFLVSIDEGGLYKCNICHERMDQLDYNKLTEHFLDRHEIVDVKPLLTNSQNSLPNVMKKWVKSNFDRVTDKNNWQCKHCRSVLRKKTSTTELDKHLRAKHFGEYKKVSSNSNGDNYDTTESSRAGNSSARAGLQNILTELRQLITKFEQYTE